MGFNYNQGIAPEDYVSPTMDDVSLIAIGNSHYYVYLRNILIAIWNEKKGLLSLNKRAKTMLKLDTNEDFDYEVVKDNISNFIIDLFSKGG